MVPTYPYCLSNEMRKLGDLLIVFQKRKKNARKLSGIFT